MKGPPNGAGKRAPRRLGVLGTLVLDAILRPGRPAATGLWGGIAYSMAVFDHMLGADWRLVPLISLGADLAEAGERCLERLSPSADLSRVRTAGPRNNRVELRVAPGGRRAERLTGGVPGWTAGEIGRELVGLDALYVNFVSGSEMTLAGARRVRDDFGGPAYADLHSIFLGIESDGVRVPRVVAQAPDMAACFDYVQMNQEEFALFRRAASGDEPTLAGRTRLLAATLGPEGADLFEAPRGAADAGGVDGGRARGPGPGPVARRVPTEPGPPDADPIGCGDAWGAALFAGLLEGRAPHRAADRAHAVAACNLACTGAPALKAVLDGRRLGDRPLGPPSPSPLKP